MEMAVALPFGQISHDTTVGYIDTHAIDHRRQPSAGDT